MKQILQNLSTGETRLTEVPLPACPPNGLLIRASRSLISIGTERMLVEFGKANLLDKARQQPEKVKMVLAKIRTDGLAATIESVKSKLDQPLPLGYCHVGRVIETGEEVNEFAVGDRVVSNGPHASMVTVSRNLAANIPDEVDDKTAAFTVPASIGLQGIRLAGPTLGESFVVSGLGLIGLLTVQLLKAHGCRVLGIDFDEGKLALARQFGAETFSLAGKDDPVKAGMAFSRGRGVDGVIITASTKSSDPVSQAANMCRKRGRIVLVGVTGLELNRNDFYKKELSFQASCSYGPGRYDSQYEEKGQDYPFGFVRWTEQRNFEAVLDMMADGRLDVAPLVTHRFDFEDALEAYDVLGEDRQALGILLRYSEDEHQSDAKTVALTEARAVDAAYPVCGFIGAGNYASRILIPAFVTSGAQLDTIVSSGGMSATHHGKKHGFRQASTDSASVLESEDINTVVIVTRHNTHARYVIEALKRKKNVFVEKPLALDEEDLTQIEEAYRAAGVRLMVGFNRRFAPQIVRMKELIDAVNQPRTFMMTMNAGAIPADAWIQDKQVGGGRIVGEACHYVDLMRFLAGSEIISVQARCIGPHPGVEVREDKAVILLGFADGSFGTIHYLANGGKAFPKERIEVFAGDAVLQLDNFRKLRGFGWPNFRAMNLARQDKGQKRCAAEFLKSIEEGRPAPIPFEEIMEVSRVTLMAARELQGTDGRSGRRS